MVGTPLVLVPGLLCDAQLWRPQQERLADTAQSWVADATRHDSIADIARAILTDVPFASFALAGLSMGGYVTLEMIRQAPARITHLALLDTSARPDTPDKIANREALMAFAERGRFLGVTDALLPQLIHPSRLADAALTATIKQMARNVGKEAFIRQQTAIMRRIDSRPHLADIRCPTLVLCGREDALTPPALHEEMAATIPAARLEIIDHCGHLSPLEQPDAVAAAMRAWLAA